MIQLEALFEGEVSTGEDPAQGELQHSQSTLQLIIQHLDRGTHKIRGELSPTLLPLLAGPGESGLTPEYGLWSS